MPFVEAGKYVNSYSENFAPYNTEWNMGRNIYFAQTFALAEGSRLFRVGFVACSQMPFDPWRHSVRLTDINGKPLSVDLYMDEVSSQYSAVCGINRPRWETHDWPFPYFPAGTYAIVLSRPGSPDTQRAKMHGITPAFTSPTKKTWRSLDYGVTWTEIANTQLSHAAYGYNPPPDPPPPAAIGNWYITNIVQTETADGYQIVVTTNVPAHLFLRWTLAPPGQHIKTVMQRGAPVQKIIDQCFVATNDINQAEAGDTLTHTFLVEPWPVCQTRWFYFWGCRVMQRQPSTSPIYEKHKLPPTLPTARCNAQMPPIYGHDAGSCREYSSGFQPTQSFKATSVDVTFYRQSTYPQCRTFYLNIYTASAAALPQTLLWTSPLTTIPLFAQGVDQLVNVPITNYTLVAGTRYAFSIQLHDIYYNENNPRIGIRMTAGTPTCPITPAVANNTYSRRYTRYPGRWCYGTPTVWSPYVYNFTLVHKFYGTDA